MGHTVTPAALGPCSILASTGSGQWIPALALLGAACLILGLALVTRSHGRLPLAAVLVLALLGCAVGAAFSAAVPAHAASGCVASDNTVTIIQTSTMAGLVPGLAPVPIHGIVINNSSDSAQVSSVVVSIVGISKASAAPSGTCGAGDYVILAPRMPVDRIVVAHGAVVFAGAAIGFTHTARNQDACQGAVVQLKYDLVP
jgi:hypothetical protein